MTEENEDDIKGYIHSVETGGTVDGPGIRYVVFLSGCPLRCQYCHNPDMMKMKRSGQMTVDEVFDDIMGYRSFMTRTGGGVTLSGGEPLAQPEFTAALLRRCKKEGLHTALDTSGYLGLKATDKILEDVDVVLLDIKSALPETYKETTGVDLEPTLNFARRLNDLNVTVWLRFVLVPGLTDAPENIEALADFIKPMENIERVDILPFHKMGEHKWEELGLKYKLKDTKEPSEKDIAAAKEIFEKRGIKVH